MSMLFGDEYDLMKNAAKSAGFGASNNKGVEAATGNLIAIINSDA